MQFTGYCYTNDKYKMIEKITIKNKINWLLALIMPITLLILSFLIFVLLPFSFKSSIVLSILNHLYSAVITIELFVLLLLYSCGIHLAKLFLIFF